MYIIDPKKVARFSYIGDGLFRSIENVSVRDLNGKVTPGQGLKIRINDYVGLYKNTIFGNDIELENKVVLELDVRPGVWYVNCYPRMTVTGTRVYGEDFKLEPNPPEAGICFAKLTIPEGATQVTQDMIDESVKTWIVDLADLVQEVPGEVNVEEIIQWIRSGDAAVAFVQDNRGILSSVEVSENSPVTLEVGVVDSDGVVDIFANDISVTLTPSEGIQVNPSSGTVKSGKLRVVITASTSGTIEISNDRGLNNVVLTVTVV